MTSSSAHIVILGGGTGGIAVAARLRRLRPQLSISLVEPSDTHYYQPLWTLAGAGLARKETTARSTADLIPQGVTWIQDSVVSVNPDQQTVALKTGRELCYDALIVATGLKLDWSRIEGLEGQLGKNGICSIYQYDQVDYTAQCIQNLEKGRAIFVMPPVPIKCAGAPQKIMYLAEHLWRKKGVRPGIEVNFMTAGKAIFGIPTFAEPLAKIVAERGIQPYFQHRLVQVDAAAHTATFEVTNAEGAITRTTQPFDLLHIVPPMSAHNFVAQSGLACETGDQKGWLAVDKHTLQHLQYKNIFGIGDVTGIPNSKTGAAIRKQYPIVAENLIAVLDGRQPALQYDGYSSCPLMTEIGKVMLAEFGYDGRILPSFPLDPSVPRRSYWHLKKDFLPKLYWYGMMRGLV